MNMKRMFVATALGLCVLAGPSSMAGQAAGPGPAAFHTSAADWSNVLSAQRLIGNRVESIYGHDIAKVADVIFDVEGDAVHTILEVRDGEGGTTRLVAVPYQRFSFVGPSVLVLPATQAQLLAEPEFDYTRPPSLALGGS